MDTYFFVIREKNMADNVLDSGPPSAKRPKLSSPALSVSASDGNGKYFLTFLNALGYRDTLDGVILHCNNIFA